ncbi:hypothetical protein [Candidatus Bealeia paramacronuclearis]
MTDDIQKDLATIREALVDLRKVTNALVVPARQRSSNGSPVRPCANA